MLFKTCATVNPEAQSQALRPALGSKSQGRGSPCLPRGSMRRKLGPVQVPCVVLLNKGQGAVIRFEDATSASAAP